MLVNCNSGKEADALGNALLTKRLCSCFDIFSRQKTAYFWPPRSKKIETGKGALLIIETLPYAHKKAEMLVKRLHSDTLPFIGYISIDVFPAYYAWVKNELT